MTAIRGPCVLVLVLFACAVCAQAGLVTISVLPGSTLDGHPVTATVELETFTDELGVRAYGLQNNPTSIIQGLSGIDLNIPGGLTAGGILFSSAPFISVASDGTYTPLGVGPTGWLVSGGTQLCVLCAGAAGPQQLLIGYPAGDGEYDSNASIAGNGPHNPLLQGEAYWRLSVLGLTPQHIVSVDSLRFGTDGDPLDVTTTVPEPSTAVLLGVGLPVLGYLGWRRRRRLNIINQS